MSDWISTKDRMPEIGKPVLVYDEDGKDSKSEISIDCRICSQLWEHQGCFTGITYWMPLPLPPKV